MVMVIIRTVDVAVAQFLSRRIPYFLDGDSEMQRHARERMIAVDGDLVHIHADNGDHPRPRLTHGMKLHPHLDVIVGIELGTVKLLNQAFIPSAIGIFRRDHCIYLIALRLTLEGRFQPRDDIANTVDISERTSAVRTIEFRTLRIGEGIIYGDDFVLGDLHEKSFPSGQISLPVYAFISKRPSHAIADAVETAFMT